MNHWIGPIEVSDLTAAQMLWVFIGLVIACVILGILGARE